MAMTPEINKIVVCTLLELCMAIRARRQQAVDTHCSHMLSVYMWCKLCSPGTVHRVGVYNYPTDLGIIVGIHRCCSSFALLYQHCWKNPLCRAHHRAQFSVPVGMPTMTSGLCADGKCLRHSYRLGKCHYCCRFTGVHYPVCQFILFLLCSKLCQHDLPKQTSTDLCCK